MDNLYNLINNLQNINNKLDNNILINNNIATFKIKNGNINVINYKDNKRFNTIIQFLIDIANTYKNLELDLHLCYGDYLGANNIDIIDMREESKNDYEKHTFYYGISNDNNDVMRIVNTKPINLPCPVFVFTKEKSSNNILFPSLQLINKTKYNSNRKDLYSWGSTHEFEDQDFNLKKRNIPIMRNTNIVADLNNISRIKLLEYSFNNPNILDFKLGSKELHKAFGNYVLDKQFIKLYKYKNIINSNIDTNKFYEWFRCDNYINYDDIIKNNKYIMIGYGGQYLPFI